MIDTARTSFIRRPHSPIVRLLIGRNPRRTLWRILITTVVLTVICTQVLLPARIMGASMEPTVHNGS